MYLASRQLKKSMLPDITIPPSHVSWYSAQILFSIIPHLKYWLNMSYPDAFWVFSPFTVQAWKPHAQFYGCQKHIHSRQWRLLTRIRSLGNVTAMLGFIVVCQCTSSHTSLYTYMLSKAPLVTRCICFNSIIFFLLLTRVLINQLMYVWFTDRTQVL